MVKASDSDIKRENANIATTPHGRMLMFGSEGAKQFMICFAQAEHARAHREGDIHNHDMDFYTLTTTCCQSILIKLFKGGFCSGHGSPERANDIASYAAAGLYFHSVNQNDQHGGKVIVNFDYGMAEGVRKTFIRLYSASLCRRRL
jgi:ribonucleoside-triphosphate reductase